MGKAKVDILLRRRLFCDAYLANGMNGVEAARQAQYTGSDAVLAVHASRMLKSKEVQDYLAAKVRETTGVTPEIVINDWANHLRFNISDLLTGTGGTVSFNLDELRKAEKSRSIESLTIEDTEAGKRVKVKCYSKLKAGELLGRALGMFSSKDDKESGPAAFTDEAMLEFFQTEGWPKSMWPPGVLAYYESITKPVKNKER